MCAASPEGVPAGSPLPARGREGRTLLWLLACLGLAAFLALVLGDAGCPGSRVFAGCWQVLRGQAIEDVTSRVVLEIRLPRVLLAVLVGAGMGLAGVASQALFRNPLASPYVLGVSSGSAVGAVVATLLLSHALGYWTVPAASVACGLLVSACVFWMARRSRQFSHSLLLAGVAISAFCSAVTGAALYLAGERLQVLVLWLMGGLWLASWRDVLVILPVSMGAALVLRWLAPAMDVVLVGERSARDLGVDVMRLQVSLLVLISVTTAVGVAVSGVIGFVGLVVPHLLRLRVGARHAMLLPASAVGGALLLLLADTLARTLASPAEIPVGIVTALAGAPVFLWMLGRRGALEGLA